MASPAKPYSSSIPFKINPNMKKSELNDPMRKSFSGNPFSKPSITTNRRSFNPTTPANSPSDFPRRHSTSRESIAFNKENGKDPNPKSARIKSPAPSKGTKNFMSPTISASSKINASPRKKILVERNETVRSSVSFFDVKGLFTEDKEPAPDIALKQKKVPVSDVQSIITEKVIESTAEVGSNQKVSFSDVKRIINEDTVSAPEGLNQKLSFADNESISANLAHDSQSSSEEPLKSTTYFDYKESENDSDSAPETITEEKDSVNVDASFKISPRETTSPCPVLEPLDSDPLMLPYDPKTNFLSPRPQFLYYRPNPRIEVYQERGGKQLDELFASESYSDTDVSAEPPSDSSERDSEDISSEETMEGEEEEELHVAEPNQSIKAERMSKQLDELFASESYSDTDVSAEPPSDSSERDSEDISSEETMEGEEEELHVAEPNQSFKAERMSKPCFSTRSKFITLLLFLGFAYFSVLVVNSPSFAPGLEEISLLNFQVPPEVTEFAKSNFDRFTQNLEHWSDSFLAYVSNIISSSREVHKLVPFQYANLSLLMEDHMIEGQLMFDSSPMEPIWGRDAGTELIDDDQHYREIEEVEVVDEDADEDQESEEGQIMFDSSPMEPIWGRDAGTELIDDDQHYREIEEVEVVDEDADEEKESEEGQLMFDSIPMEPIWERDAGTELIDYDQHYREIEEVEVVDEDVDEDQECEAFETLKLVSEPDVVKLGTQDEMIEEAEESKGVEFSVQIEAEHNRNVDVKDQQSIMSLQATEVQRDISETVAPEGDRLNIAETLFHEEENSENLKIEDSAENSQIPEVADFTISGQEESQFLTKNNVMGFSLVVLCLLAASPFIYIKRGIPSMANASSVPAVQPVLKSEYSPVSVGSYAENWETEVDVAESCPSEMMSSYTKTSSYYSNKRVKESNEPCLSEMSSSDRTSSSYSNKGLKESNQYQSQERKTRKTPSRQSLASSDYSMGSHSYGSFTMLEKIHSNHGGGDEEIVTPVRRSSRIRSQVTSP